MGTIVEKNRIKDINETEIPEEENTAIETTDERYAASESLRSQEQQLLERIGELKEIEVKEPVKQIQDDNQQDDLASQTSDISDLDYYGYTIEKDDLEDLEEGIKGKISKAKTWLSVWITRLMQMSR